MVNSTKNLFGGELATLWADCFVPNPHELEFFRGFINAYGQPSLEIGSGAGRILVGLRQLGLEVDGVEPSPEMISLCRQRLVKERISATVWQQNALNLTVGRRYRTAFLTRGVFQSLIDDLEVSIALKKIGRALCSGGHVAIAFVRLGAVKKASTEWRPLRPDFVHSQSVKNYLVRNISQSSDVETNEFARAFPRVTKIGEVRTKRYDLEAATRVLESHSLIIKGVHYSYADEEASTDGDFILVGQWMHK